jgi:hypothetical protein
VVVVVTTARLTTGSTTNRGMADLRGKWLTSPTRDVGNEQAG